MNNLTNNGQKLIDLPKNFATVVINNFKTTFNIDNFVNYLTTDNYNEIKDYSKSVIQTGVTLYGGYNVGKVIYNQIQTNKVMNKVNNLTVYDNTYNTNSLNSTLIKSSSYEWQDVYFYNSTKVINEYKWANPDTFISHYIKHKSKISAKNPAEMAKMAQDLYMNRENYRIKYDPDVPKYMVYDESTRYFGSYNSDGTIRTFFRTNNHNYFENIKGVEIKK